MLRLNRVIHLWDLLIPLAAVACAEGTKLESSVASSAGRAAVLGTGGVRAPVPDGKPTISDVAIGAAGANAGHAVGGTKSWGGSAPVPYRGETESYNGAAGAAGSAAISYGPVASGSEDVQSAPTAPGAAASGGACGSDPSLSAGGAESALTIAGPASGLGIKISKQWTETTTVKVTFALVNQGGQPVELTNVKIRYYFTMDTWETPVFEIYDARKDSDRVNVKAEFFTVSLPGADRYVELSFPRTAPVPGAVANTLQAGGQLTIQSGLHDQNWIPVNVTNDFSYIGTAGFTDRMPVYVGNQIVWGVEPGAAQQSTGAAGGSGSGTEAGLPPGVPSVTPGAAGSKANAESSAGGASSVTGLVGLAGSAGAG